MTALLAAVAILICSGLLSLTALNRPATASLIGSIGAVVGCIVGLFPAVSCLLNGESESIRLAWQIPGGAFHAHLDSLSAFFLVPIFVLSSIAAVYGGEYMMSYKSTKRLAPQWFYFNLFVAAMAMVVIAHNVVLFLVSWEVMSLAAFFLVTFEHEKRDVRVAGWIYLVATHLGAAFLLAMFLLLGNQAHSLDFAEFGSIGQLSGATGGIIFSLCLVGFGAKAGFVPLHVWLPEAHPAAPSHVSALMSGVMIKIGIYGILRTMTFLGSPATWWGPTLMIIGFVGALLGISLALMQRDIKRALAYSSIENIGLIAFALGAGLWGLTNGHTIVAILGLTGGMLHIWNHALMKGLMFLCSGSILHGAGTKNLERLGGLMKLMPRTGTAMVLGSLAIAALPPLNGFVSEWLMYVALLRGGLEFGGMSQTVMMFAAGGLALVGGLALICFVRIAGIALLGEPRSDESRHAHESSRWMTVPIGILATLCVASAIFPSIVANCLSGALTQVFGVSIESVLPTLTTLGKFNATIWAAVGLGGLILVMFSRRSEQASDTTWGCGYFAPNARMQYTGHSFSEFAVMRILPKSLRPNSSAIAVDGLFPAKQNLTSEYSDPMSREIYQPFFDRWAERFAKLRWVQQGKIHYYVLYFVVVLVLAFGWVVLRDWISA